MSPPPSFKPTLILHGGAGNLQRTTIPPSLYKQYHASLLSYLRSTKSLLENGSTALDAAVHAVSLMEDDELFNCGRGSVFTSAGTIEMEASVMVTSVHDTPEQEQEGSVKRGAGVIGLKNVRHPIRLAREVLLRTGQDSTGTPLDDSGGNMHSQLCGAYVEDLARKWGLEFKPDEWFWTRRRWEEHRRGLEGVQNTSIHTDTPTARVTASAPGNDANANADLSLPAPGVGAGLDAGGTAVTLSQGTVGCVCLDQWGNLAVATSTGGLTNKVPGRVGDTPTLGAGFWAESWVVDVPFPCYDFKSESKSMLYIPRDTREPSMPGSASGSRSKSIWDMTLRDCLPGPSTFLGEFMGSGSRMQNHEHFSNDVKQPLLDQDACSHRDSSRRAKRRAVAVSGTGNGDSFLRIAAARTACAMVRFSLQTPTLTDAVRAVAGAGGELQRSAGQRWGKTGEGEGGIIGIEAEVDDGDHGTRLRRGTVVFDFNCGGMWRAWVEEAEDGREVERVMVFKEEYR